MLTTWSPLFVEVEALAGNRDVAKSHFRATIDRLRSTTRLAHATSQAALLADLLLDAGDIDDADLPRLAENEAFPSDVLVQFLWRARAPACSPGGETAEAEEIARDAVGIASLTDGLRDRARAHLALAEVLHLGGSGDARAEATWAASFFGRRAQPPCSTPSDTDYPRPVKKKRSPDGAPLRLGFD